MIKNTEPKQAYCSNCGIYITLAPGVLKAACPKCGKVCGAGNDDQPVKQELKSKGQ